MKTYKTWEVVKLLTENSNLQFFDSSGRTLGLSKKTKKLVHFGEQYMDGESPFIFTLWADELNMKYTLIQEPVDFMTALQARNAGKQITCKWGINGYLMSHYPPNKELIDTDGHRMCADEILEGKWYIEE